MMLPARFIPKTDTARHELRRHSEQAGLPLSPLSRCFDHLNTDPGVAEAGAAAADPLWFRALIECAYTFGFRRGELLGLKCEQIDLLARTIRLRRSQTKNKRPRQITMTSRVYQLLSACCSGRQPEEHVFRHEDNRPVREFREKWETLCVNLGFGQRVCPRCEVERKPDHRCPQCERKWKNKQCKYLGLLFHDMRRSAVRNMVRRGIPQRVAMEISGHRTTLVFDRYNIIDESDLKLAALKIERGAVVKKIGHEMGKQKPFLPTSDGSTGPLIAQRDRLKKAN